jgi:hypothetical protein
VGRTAKQPRWVDRLVVEAVQFDLIRTFGSMPRLRDKHALEARWREHRSDTRTSRTQTSRIGSRLRLRTDQRSPVRRQQAHRLRDDGGLCRLNGYEIDAPEDEVVGIMLALAAGGVRTRLAGWCVRVRAASVDVRLTASV